MIQLYNTLSKRKEALDLVSHDQLKMFVCGPTVYDYIHMGNARTFIVFDSIAKYLRYRGYKLTYIQNITDIDDKIINRAHESGGDFTSIAQEYEQAFLHDTQRLHITAVDQYIKASANIPEIMKQIETLISKGHAYVVSSIDTSGHEHPTNHDVYFSVASFPDYGKLSGRGLDDTEAEARVEAERNKRDPRDFVLWKAQYHDYEPTWQSPWGLGRPGWHIEDTAITEKYLGQQYDIHGGGQDLIFPHHEAEIAQQEAASGKSPFVRYWLHSGFLVVKGHKMAKSVGNFKTAHSLLESYSPEALRMYALSAHYRSPLDFNDTSLKSAEAAVQRLADFRYRLKSITTINDEEVQRIKELVANKRAAFQKALDDDFNTPQAFGLIFELMHEVNQIIKSTDIGDEAAEELLLFLNEVNHIFNIIPDTAIALPQEVQELINRREQARANADYGASDTLRQQINQLGYSIDDTSSGPLVKKL